MPISPDPNRKPRARVKAPGRPYVLPQESMVLAGEMQRASWTDARQGGVYFLNIDEIISRQGIKTYRDMRHDDQVKTCLEFKKVLVHGRSWEIKPADDSAQAKEIADFVEFNLRKINLKDIFKQALTALDFGFSVGEIIWEVGQYDSKGAILIKNIKHRDPEDMELKIDGHGNFLGVRQGVYRGNVEISPDKIWHWAHQSEFGNHYGRSDLRAAYRSWWAKKFVINFWNVYLERMGTPLTMMKYPQGASENLKDTLKSILGSLTTKTEILVPEGVEVDLVEATRAGTPNYGECLSFHNNSIARSILMVSLLGAGGDDVKRGADSQSRLHLRLMFKMADDLSQNLIYTFSNQVINRLVDMNFDHENLYPTFFFQDYGEFEGIEVADTIRLLHAAGIIDMDQNDVNYARSVLGLPLRGEGDEEDEVVRPQPLPPPADSNKPPPSAGQGNQLAKGSSNAP